MDKLLNRMREQSPKNFELLYDWLFTEKQEAPQEARHFALRMSEDYETILDTFKHHREADNYVGYKYEKQNGQHKIVIYLSNGGDA